MNSLEIDLVPNKIDIFPLFDGTYVGKVNVSKNFHKTNKISTIIILDISGSMCSILPSLKTTIIPRLLKSWGYKDSDSISVITFQNTSMLYNTIVSEFKNMRFSANGGTNMSGVFANLSTCIDNDILHGVTNFRILTLSDGEIGDKPDTINNAKIFAATYGNKNIKINSQAIRLFTSYSQPDTTALASILQLNNSCGVKLIDVDCTKNTDSIIFVLEHLIKIDTFGSGYTLSSQNDVFCNNPWDIGTNTIFLNTDNNTIWLNSKPTKILLNKFLELPINVMDAFTYDNMDIIENQLTNYLQYIKVLNVINNSEKITTIKNYFDRLEVFLNTSDISSHVKDTILLQDRIKFFKHKISAARKGFFITLSELSNNNNVSKLNSLQQAEYLREVPQTKNARNLARIVLKQDTDFEKVLKDEVRAMNLHISEIIDIDSSNHKVSFISQGTTLDGIISACDLVKENMLDNMSFYDILSVCNIVGVACDGPVGEYPDPMVWRVNEIYPAYISIADIIMIKNFDSDKQSRLLSVPGLPESRITNCIPIFENERLHNFLITYAPNMLEYLSGYGMRQIIACVPATHRYTICNAIWKLTENISKKNCSYDLTLFKELIETYTTAIGDHFKHVLNYIVEQDENLSYYICNNGITNMISPMVELIKSKNTKYMSNILRALYSFEIFKRTKKMFNDAEKKTQKIKGLLYELLSINPEENRTCVGELFVIPKNPVYYNNYSANIKKVNELLEMYWYLDYVTVLPNIIDYVLNNSSDVPRFTLSEEQMKIALDIDYSTDEFKFFNIIQSFLYNEKDLRVDNDNKKMLIVDLKNKSIAERMVKQYVENEYRSIYGKDMALKKNIEDKEISSYIVDKLVNTTDINEFVNILRNGVTIKSRSLLIANTNSLGFVELRDQLISTSTIIPEKLKKICFFVLATDDDNKIIWNNGNVLFVNINTVKEIFIKENGENMFAKFYEIYKEHGLYIYRDGPLNRHSHGNEKPSYFAYGFTTIDKMHENVSDEEWKKYISIHKTCCGFLTYEETKRLRKEKKLSLKGIKPRSNSSL